MSEPVNLSEVFEGDWPGVARNLRGQRALIQALQGEAAGVVAEVVTAIFGVAGIKVRFGTNSWAWPGGTVESNTVNVTHGLGTTPTVVLISPGASGRGLGWESPGQGPVTFSARARADVVLAGGTTLPFFWLVVG